MTPAQERKIDMLNDTCLRMEGKFNLLEERISQHRDSILDQEKDLTQSRKRLENLEGDRNKVIGAMWLGGTSIFSAAIAFVYSVLKK